MTKGVPHGASFQRRMRGNKKMQDQSKALQPFRLDGKVAFITGASRGLGLAMARAMGHAGARVVLISRKKDEVEAAAADVQRETGQPMLGLQMDVTNEQEVNEAVERTVAEFGQLDILVNNAGINIRKPIHKFTLSEWQQVMDINLTGVFLCTRAVAEHMMERKTGRVINMASMMSFISLPERIAYATSKGALIMFTKTMALEWAPYNITVNAIAPGPFKTELNAVILQNPEVSNFFNTRIPLGRWGEVDELGNLAVYLASDASAFITGSTIVIDGGWTAQ